MNEPHTPFSRKHPAAPPDPDLAEAVRRAAEDGEISCRRAFEVAAATGRDPGEIGRTADLLDLRLVRCQLGLFGYPPQKKIVSPAETVPADLEAAIRGAMVGERLACREAWRIADDFERTRIALAEACEALGVKIKPCQLGAF